MLSEIEQQHAPFQIEGIDFLCRQKRAILGDAMGLRKTSQAIGAANRNNYKKILIVCPSRITYVWAGQIELWSPGSTYAEVAGSKNRVARSKIIQGDQRFTIIGYSLIGPRNIYETDPSSGKRIVAGRDLCHMDELAKQKYDLVIFDEAHRLRNFKSDMFSGARYICRYAKPEGIIHLTGTPIVNYPEDIWPLLHLIDPIRYSSKWVWVWKHCEKVYLPFKPGPAAGKLVNPEGLMEELRPYVLRRHKSDVLPDLPKVTYTNIDIELSTGQKKLYATMKKRRSIEYRGVVIDAKNAMSALGRLKQICVGPETLLDNADAKEHLSGGKVDALFDLLDDIARGEQKVVIFSQYARAIRLLAPRLLKDYGIVSITGADSEATRVQRENIFRNDPRARGLACTYGTGGEGVDYTAASIIITLDIWWNSAVNSQAIARCDRSGQKLPVTVYNINARGTVEDRVWQKVALKEGLFSAMIPEQRILRLALEEVEDSTSEDIDADLAGDIGSDCGLVDTASCCQAVS